MGAVIGVDPGNNGAVAVLTLEKGEVIFLRSFQPAMPRDEVKNVLTLAAEISKLYGGKEAFLEKVGYIGRHFDKRTGRTKQDGGQGAFTFGRTYGMLEMGLICQGLTVYDVTPTLWMGRMDCMTGGDKNITKKKAQELFPTVKITLANSDALLIAEFGRRWILSRP